VQDLTVEDFAARVNDDFRVSDGSASWQFSLVEAAARGSGRPGKRTPFALLFLGPAAPILPQAMYRFEHPALPPLDLFIVPVGPDGDRMRYEAIFT